MKDEFSHIGGLVYQVLRELGLWDEVSQSAIFVKWEKIVGEYIAKNLQPVRFDPETGELWVKSISPEWRMEFFNLRESLTRKINQSLGTPIVKKIRIV